MAPGKDDSTMGESEQSKKRGAKPAWADGLKKLYDSVVDEPLPSDLENLLAQLDSDSEGKAPQGGNN